MITDGLVTDGLVNVRDRAAHLMLVAEKVGGNGGYFILDMIEFVELHMDEFRKFSAWKAHPYPFRPSKQPEESE